MGPSLLRTSVPTGYTDSSRRSSAGLRRGQGAKSRAEGLVPPARPQEAEAGPTATRRQVWTPRGKDRHGSRRRSGALCAGRDAEGAVLALPWGFLACRAALCDGELTKTMALKTGTQGEGLLRPAEQLRVLTRAQLR